MRKRRGRPIMLAAVLASIVAFLAGLTVCVRDASRNLSEGRAAHVTEADIRAFAEEQSGSWRRIAQALSGETMQFSAASAAHMDALFDGTGLVRIDYDPETRHAAFIFGSDSFAGEGSAELHCLPGGTPRTLGESIAGTNVGGRAWTLVADGEGVCRWEAAAGEAVDAVAGSGADRVVMGSIDVEEIRPDWFYVEIWLPT